MTLHITTITPTHVVTVGDRLIGTPGGMLEYQDDRHKHFVLACDDARVAVGFTGVAGIAKQRVNGEVLVDDTLTWLIELATDTGRSARDLDAHLNSFRDSAQPHLDMLQRRHGRIDVQDRGLAIQVCGWKHETQFNCVIENYMDRHCNVHEARDSFTTWIKTYDDEPFEDGWCSFILGQRSLALEQTEAVERHSEAAALGDPEGIFRASVDLIRAAASMRPNLVGTQCSGLRLSLSDPGIQAFDDRPGAVYELNMPEFVRAGAGISIRNIRGQRRD